jgi:hypothetical protein
MLALTHPPSRLHATRHDARPHATHASFPCATQGERGNALPDNWTVVVLERRSNRLILNQDELIAGLTARFNRPVVTVSMESYTLVEQATALRGAGVVVGMHGSLLISSLFMPVGATLVELFPFGVPPEGCVQEHTRLRVVYLPFISLTCACWWGLALLA